MGAGMVCAVSATVARPTTRGPRDVDSHGASAGVARAALREVLEQCGAATDAVDTDEMLRYALNGARPPDGGAPDFVVAAAQAVLAAYPPALIRPASAPGSPPGSPLPSHRSAIRTPTPRRPAAERQGPERWPFTSPAQPTRSPAPIRPASASPTPRGLGAMVSSTPLGGCGCGSRAALRAFAAVCGGVGAQPGSSVAGGAPQAREAEARHGGAGTVADSARSPGLSGRHRRSRQRRARAAANDLAHSPSAG